MKKAEFESLNFPDKSGVYIFKDEKDTILYIGKATSLRDRVRSYFGDDLVEERGKRLVDMVTYAKSVSYEVTDSVLEALILEANLISKYKPKYNAIGKDDKSFYFVVITKESFPRVLIMRGRDIEKKVLQKELSISQKFGPYPHGSQLKEALRIIRKIFPFNDKDSIKKDQAEFYRQIKLAPDLGNSEIQKKYNETIQHIVLFLKGKKQKLLLALKKEMDQYAKKLFFEQASEVKKKIFALEHIKDVSLIKKEDIEKRVSDFRIESYDIAHISGTNMVGVMTVIEHGEPNPKEYRKFIIQGFSQANDTGALGEVLERRLAHTEWPFPQLIVVDGALPQKSKMESILNTRGIKIPVVAVVKNEKHKPKGILGLKKFTEKYKQEIILANAEAHRFALQFHRKRRSRI
jgi:excinuclease ABC subunit C